MKRPVAAIAAPPSATVHAATPARSNEACLDAADVGEDPEAAVRVPLGDDEDAVDRELEADDEPEERELVTMDEDADEEEDEEAALRCTVRQLGASLVRSEKSATHEDEVAWEEGAEVVAPAPASLRVKKGGRVSQIERPDLRGTAYWVGMLVKQDDAPGRGVVTVRVSDNAFPSPLGRNAKT